MTRHTTCLVEGCQNPRERGIRRCLAHLDERLQCQAQAKDRDDEGRVVGHHRCRKVARPGDVYCSTHGATKGKQIAETGKAISKMQAFVQPYAGPVSAVGAYEAELRRTLGRIKWLETEISQLESEQDLVWGMTRQEHVGAAEFPGVNTLYESKLNAWEEMLWRERQHLHRLLQTGIRANLEERKLAVQAELVNYTYGLIQRTIRALGHDTEDPEVRRIVGRAFESEIEAQE